jgi:hypothetical protein
MKARKHAQKTSSQRSNVAQQPQPTLKHQDSSNLSSNKNNESTPTPSEAQTLVQAQRTIVQQAQKLDGVFEEQTKQTPQSLDPIAEPSQQLVQSKQLSDEEIVSKFNAKYLIERQLGDGNFAVVHVS